MLGATLVHLVRKPGKLRHVRCPLITETNHRRLCIPSCPGYVPPQPTLASLNITLLQTCRQIYSETAHILYANNTFDVYLPRSLLYLSNTVRPKRLALVQRLHHTYLDDIPPRSPYPNQVYVDKVRLGYYDISELDRGVDVDPCCKSVLTRFRHQALGK